MSCLLFFRRLLRCTRRPMGHRGQLRKGRRAEVRAGTIKASGSPTVKEREATTSTPAKRRRRRLNPPARRGDPSSHTIQRGSVVGRLLLLGSRRNALGPLLLRRLESSQAPVRSAVQAAQGSAQDEDGRPHHFWVIIKLVILCRPWTDPWSIH